MIYMYMHMTWFMDYYQFKNVTDYYKNIDYRQSKRMSERLQIECKWVIGWVVFCAKWANFNHRFAHPDTTTHLVQFNRFLHTFLGKIGWSSTSDRNCMSFREWSVAKRAKRNKNFYHEWKITRSFPTTHVSTYFFRKPTTFTIANS
jgi:hypothetical protein